MKSDDIRTCFLEFFEARGHTVERSDLVVPSNDPTLLFTSAGMVQFKPYYTGEAPLPYRRATTSQKCLRAGGKANDLDEVGKTSRHMTFFEMLGNFSFGDYFKQEAIAFAWEFCSDQVKLNLDDIWVSVYEDDDESCGIWEREIGIAPHKISRLGAKDNFWGPAGETGACGPCSELHIDRGEAVGCGRPECGPGCEECERFLEFWNLVFPQYDQQADGSKPPLVNRGIDTGMGLERLATMLQGKETVFDVNHIFPIIQATESLSGKSYANIQTPFRVIADHARAVSFLIADGVLPSNEGRGYVERRLLRRASRFGRELGLERPFLHEISETVVELMGRQYPELLEKRMQIQKIVQLEEERFASTLARGMDILEETFESMKKDDCDAVPGEDLFKLHDTYGFPLDLATDISEDRGYTVDREGFEAAMEGQRKKARSAWTGSGEEALAPVYRTLLDELGATEFVGYDGLSTDAVIRAIVRNGESVNQLSEGEEAEVVLDMTPFYSESGGQVGDTGVLDAVGGNAHVSNTKSLLNGLPAHHARATGGALKVGDKVSAQVDESKRPSTENHHTATHLLQAALQQTLGEHVHQAGSLVAPDRLRFDFTHFEAIGPDRLQDIERLVNEHIRTNSAVTVEEQSIDRARAAGAMALFGEKYDDVVRVVSVGDISMELCGGTHVSETGAIGYFKILSESAISSGVRRIEAVCGKASVETIQSGDRALHAIGQALGAPVDDIEVRVAALLEENKRLGREVANWKQAAATGGSADYMSQVQDVDGTKLLAAALDGQDASGLRVVMDSLRERLPSGIVVLGANTDGKAILCVAVSKDLVASVKAGDIVKELAPIVGGGGGGRPDMAQAGGKHGDKIPEAIAKAGEVVKKLLG
ncbi:MAG: alanine--tRNA ligase [Candidatus Hydrogenedentes bacterium]|nr:alanine--tRNA ligase [Candidatus Hydrogenedentota bacterium]